MGDEARTIGSGGTGLGQIFTLSSAAIPASFIVQALLLLLTREIYYKGKTRISRSFPGVGAGEQGAYRIVVYESRFVLETVHGVTPRVELVTIGVWNRYHRQHSNESGRLA